MNLKHADFIKELVKGKIAEIIFEQMFRESGNYTILHSGYEYTLPELAQYQHQFEEVRAVIDTIRNAPDFVLVSPAKREVYLVEVKYRTHLMPSDILEICLKTVSTWKHCWLFVATPNGFYFEPCNSIIQKNGMIGLLVNEKFVDHAVRDQYLELLRELEPKHLT